MTKAQRIKWLNDDKRKPSEILQYCMYCIKQALKKGYNLTYMGRCSGNKKDLCYGDTLLLQLDINRGDTFTHDIAVIKESFWLLSELMIGSIDPTPYCNKNWYSKLSKYQKELLNSKIKVLHVNNKYGVKHIAQIQHTLSTFGL